MTLVTSWVRVLAKPPQKLEVQRSSWPHPLPRPYPFSSWLSFSPLGGIPRPHLQCQQPLFAPVFLPFSSISYSASPFHFSFLFFLFSVPWLLKSTLLEAASLNL